MEPPAIPPVVDAPQRKTLKYSLTRGDILRWHFYLLLHHRIVIALIAVSSVFLTWNDLRTPELAAKSIGFKVFYGVFLTCLMFGSFAVATMVFMTCTVMFKKFRGLLGDHELEIQDDGLVERTEINESMHRWRGFHKIITTGRYLYIYVTDNNVHIVPRRCFISEQEEQAFRSELQRRMAMAKSV